MTTDKLGGRKTLKVASILDEFEKDKVKECVDLVELFTAFGVPLSANGRGFTGKCPWHDDSPGIPSAATLSVDREKGLYNCFGCGETGDAFTLVEKMKGLSFRDALGYLKAGSYRTEKPVVKAKRLPVVMAVKVSGQNSGESRKTPGGG